MKKVEIIKSVYFESNTGAGTEQRALEVLAAVDSILVCQKPHWTEKIKELFMEYMEGTPLRELLGRKKGGLYWDFHKFLLAGMCDAFES